MKLSKDILRHRGEFARRIRAGEYETKNGLLMVPKMGLFAAGIGIFDTLLNGKDPDISENLLPTEMLNWLLEAGYGGATSVPKWYIAPFSNNATPANTLTGATFHSVLNEFSDYDEATRLEFVDAAAASGVKNNHASRANFTMSSGVNTTLYGAGLLEASAKLDATAGKKCGAASRFGTARAVVESDVLSVGYSVTLTSGA